MISWKSIGSHKPKRNTPLLYKGPSGYRPPNDIRVISGYRGDDHKDVDWSGDLLVDSGPMPTHWKYLNQAILD